MSSLRWAQLDVTYPDAAVIQGPGNQTDLGEQSEQASLNLGSRIRRIACFVIHWVRTHVSLSLFFLLFDHTMLM